MMRTITPVFSIIIALVVFFSVSKPMFTEIDDIKAQTAQFQEAVDSAQSRNQKLEELINKKQGHDSRDLEYLDALVPQDVDEVKMLVDLKEMAEKHNMLIGNIGVEGGGTGSPASDASSEVSGAISYNSFSTADITFGLIGTYEQFKSFLADMERSLVLMEVINITFASGEGDLQQYDLTIRAFGLPPIN